MVLVFTLFSSNYYTFLYWTCKWLWVISILVLLFCVVYSFWSFCLWIMVQDVIIWFTLCWLMISIGVLIGSSWLYVFWIAYYDEWGLSILILSFYSLFYFIFYFVLWRSCLWVMVQDVNVWFTLSWLIISIGALISSSKLLVVWRAYVLFICLFFSFQFCSFKSLFVNHGVTC